MIINLILAQGCFRFCAIFLLLIVSPPLVFSQPSIPADGFIHAEPTQNNYEIKVTWSDFINEDFYQLYSTGSFDPSPVIVTDNSGYPLIGPSWSLVTELPQNTTEYVHSTFWAQRYALCGVSNLGTASFSMVCTGATSIVFPKTPPPPATVDRINISFISARSFTVNWTHSSNTIYSRVDLRSGNNPFRQVAENDSDQRIILDGLIPNTVYTVRVCVRNQEQTASNESCRQTGVTTLPLPPSAVARLSVDNTDENPYRRTITFRHTNTQEAAVIRFSIRLFKENEDSFQEIVRIPDGFRSREYTDTFTNLQPFTGYSVWVIPYNRGGIGDAANITFTTPNRIPLPEHVALSRDSVLLSFDANAIGDYTIQKFTIDGLKAIGKINVTAPGKQSLVIENLPNTARLRIEWQLAWLKSKSELFRVSALQPHPFPEMIQSLTSVSHKSPPTPNQSPIQYRVLLRFRNTSDTPVGYLAQGRIKTLWDGRSSGGWEDVKAVKSETNSIKFMRGEFFSTEIATPKNYSEFRVCAVTPGQNFCSKESSKYQTEGKIRIKY